MDTKTIATLLNTEARILRRFLRDPRSTFQSVGSGARYSFTDKDIPELAKRFAEWQQNKPVSRVTPPTRCVDNTMSQHMRDQMVWEEEGPIIIEDIRKPGVRNRIRQEAAAQEARLAELLMARGLHISQMSSRGTMATA